MDTVLPPSGRRQNIGQNVAEPYEGPDNGTQRSSWAIGVAAWLFWLMCIFGSFMT